MLPAVFAFIALAILIKIRYDLAEDRAFAGPADHSFYFTLAKRIFSGEGLSIDYVWHFLHPWDTVTHAANDYWLPMTAVFLAGGFWLTGAADVYSALIMPGVAWLTIGVIVFVLARRVSLTVAESAWAVVVALSTPFLLERSLLGDTAIFAGLFGSLSILLSSLAVHDPRWFPAAFASIAITYSIRQDGILLGSGIAVAALWNRATMRNRMMWLGVGVAAFITCCVPMWIINERTIGTPMPTAPMKTAFFTLYEDLYAYEKTFTLRTYLAEGPAFIVISKLKTLVVELLQLPYLLGWSLLLPVIGLAALMARRRNLAVPWPFRIAAVVAVAPFLFYTLVATFPAGPGGFARSFVSVVPFVATFAVYGVASIVGRQSARVAIVATIAALNLLVAVPALRQRFEVIDARSREYQLAGRWLRDRQAQAAVVPIVMTREPWEFSELTGFSAVQIPSDGPDAICRAAQKFNASLILVPVPERPELEEAVRRGDRRFSAWANVPGTPFSYVRIEPGCAG